MDIEPSTDQDRNRGRRGNFKNTASSDRHSWLHLGENERVLWSGRQSRIPLLPSSLIFGIVLIAICGVFVLGGPMVFLPISDMTLTELNILGGVTVTISLLSTLILLVFALLALLAEVSTYLRWRFTRYLITTQELYYRTGIISESVVQIRLENIQNTRYSRSILERLFGYGDISIETSGTDGTELVMWNIPNPQQVNGVLTNQHGRIANNREGSRQSTRR
jgi:uncharacterized membrane protein YdbT with pleckstrin-like domain